MTLRFSKYQGTGNDFILLDDREGIIDLSAAQIARLCHRHFGIGADGLMLLRKADGFDFRMVYFNADGNESTMCGNGGRCITKFALDIGLIRNNARFLAVDGPHEAVVNSDGTVSLQMKDVTGIEHRADAFILNTGSPHYVQYVDDVDSFDVIANGKRIRYSAEYKPDGINVNFIQPGPAGLKVRTYERGVEDETMSCGTGVTAAAVVSASGRRGHILVPVSTPGGRLSVSFTSIDDTTATDVLLTGPATKVFDGSISMFQ